MTRLRVEPDISETFDKAFDLELTFAYACCLIPVDFREIS